MKGIEAQRRNTKYSRSHILVGGKQGLGAGWSD